MKLLAGQVGSLTKRQHAGEVAGFAAVTIAAVAFIGLLNAIEDGVGSVGSPMTSQRPTGN